MSLKSLSAAELRRAASIKEKIDALNVEFRKILGETVQNNGPVTKKRKVGRRKMGAAGRARIAAAAKARWARAKAAGKKHL